MGGRYELYLNKIHGVTVVEPAIATEYSRIAVKKGNKELLDRINFGLNKIEHDGNSPANTDQVEGQRSCLPY